MTRALLDDGHRAIGLCNVAIGFQRRWAAWLGVEPARIVVDQVGLNHLTWVRRVLLDGLDVLPDLLAAHADEIAADLELARAPARRARRGAVLLPPVLLRARRGAARAARRRAAGARSWRRSSASCWSSIATHELVEKPALLEQRGGAFYSEAALGLVSSLVSGDGAVHEVDVRNGDTIAGLAVDDVVEVPARVTRVGAQPLKQAPLAPELLGLVQHVAAYERLALTAARTRSVVDVKKALLAHPLVGQYAIAEQLLERLAAEVLA